MPEIQVIKAIEAMINKGKGMTCARSQVPNQLYWLEVPLITHSQSHGTLSVDAVGYNEPPRTGSWSYAPDHWIDRAEEWGYDYLMARSTPSPLVCKSRGKSLLLAAGPHAMVVCFALETCVIGMRTEDYREIVSQDIAGPNPDPEKAESLRTFRIPKRMIVENSSPKERTIRIVAAFVSEGWTWTINDWTSLVRLHIKSINGIWSADMLIPGTDLWSVLFDRFNGGPDWILERQAASERLRAWRKFILDDWKKGKRQTKLPQFFLSGSGGHIPVSGEQARRPIILELQLNTFGCFAGIGRYTANDILLELAIFPGLPSFFICNDDTRFQALETGIFQYLHKFSEAEYLDMASSVPNSPNPITFNEHANAIFTRKHVNAYHRSKVRMSPSLFNKYAVDGLFNDSHVIGEPYVAQPDKLLPESRSWSEVPIYYHGAPLFAFTAVRARPPTDWGNTGERSLWTKDIKAFGYRTRMGPFHFRVQLLNRPNFHGKEPGILIKGRPKKNRTGRVGRPSGGITKKKLAKLFDVQRGRMQDFEEVFCEEETMSGNP